MKHNNLFYFQCRRSYQSVVTAITECRRSYHRVSSQLSQSVVTAVTECRHSYHKVFACVFLLLLPVIFVEHF